MSGVFEVTEYPAYLAMVLDALCERGAEATRDDFDVRYVARDLYFIDTPEYASLLVNTKRRWVEASHERALPKGFPGRIYPEHVFQVWWVEDDSDVMINVPASSPRQARLFAEAPGRAECVEVDPVTWRWPSWIEDR